MQSYPVIRGNDLIVETVEQYLHAVEKARMILWDENKTAADIKYSPKLWFRGLRTFDYPLLPSIGRRNLTVEYENIYMSKFKTEAGPYIDRIASASAHEGPEAYWDWLFLMQHYGIPTRLMNWTEDPLVALVFAIDTDATAEERETDAAVWCLNPVKLNTAFLFHAYYPEGYIPNIQEREVYLKFGPHKNTKPGKKPAAVYPPVNTPRIVVQQGTFVVFPYMIPLFDMKELPDSKQYLQRIIVAKESRTAMSEQLRRYGITKCQLMPELGALTQEIFDASGDGS